jgi:hypothetical protein
MKIGRVARGRPYVAHDPVRRTEIFNFTIGAGRASDLQMLHSSAATPARYVMEMARRMAALRGADELMVVNPLVEDSPPEFGLMANALPPVGADGRARVLSDRTGLPVAYALPYRAASDLCRYLSLLSTVDAAIDARLLELVTERPVEMLELSVPMRVVGGRREFYSTPASREIYRWITTRAIFELERIGRDHREALPFAAIMPFHAGDVLFFAMALRRGTTHFRAAVVDRRYREIAEEVAPDFACLEIDLGKRATGGEAEWDWALFDAIQSDLPGGYLYVYCRPSRLYDQFPVHLIDQYAFGLGVRPSGAGAAASARCMGTPRAQRRILLHFDAGWAMKIYPDRLQRELVARLSAMGFAMTVLSRREESVEAGVTFVRFHGLWRLRDLILDHDLLIGMDSFPAHYATHVLGIPTICLFSCTHPSNSDAEPGPRYSAMQMGLACCPCGSVSRCPEYGGEQCRNFVSPTAVAAEVEAMWHNVTGERP